MRRAVSAVAVVLLLVGGPAHGQTPTPPLPQGTNTLLGRLLDVGDDTPVGGAIVTLTGFVGEGGVPERSTPAVSSATPNFTPRSMMTTGDGRFLFRNLPAGRYAVAASAFGYLPNVYPRHWVDVADRDRPSELVLRVWRAGSISGTVVDDRGEPVVGIPMTAIRWQTIGSRVMVTSEIEATTDDRGHYRLAPLRPGSYGVGALSSSTTLPASVVAQMDAVATNRTAGFEFRSGLVRGGLLPGDGHGLRLGDSVLQRAGSPPPLSPEGVPLIYASTFYPNAGSVDGATTLTVGSGDAHVGIDLSLRYGPALRMSGVVTGPEGPAPHVALRLLPAGTSGADELGLSGVDSAVTDGAGRFTFPALPAGEYELIATVFVGPEMEGTVWSVFQPVVVGPEGVDGLAVTMREGILVSGRIEFKTSAGTTPPRPGRAVVSLRPMGAGSWRGRPGLIAPDGSFTVLAARPGPYQLSFSSAGAAWLVSSVTLAGKAVADGIVSVSEQGLRDLNVVVSSTPTRLSGTAVDTSGAPDPAVDVIVFPADTTLWKQGMFHSQRVQLFHATAAGTFEATALPPGDYFVVAVPPSATVDWMNGSFLERLTAMATTVTLRDGEAASVNVKTQVIRGR